MDSSREAGLRPVSPRFWIARQTVLAAIAMPVFGAGVIIAAALGGGVLLTVPAGIAVVAAAMWTIERGRYRSWGYLERDADLIVRRGLLFRRVSVVPYGRMQFIDVTAGPVDRLFDLATVQLHTAAAATDARIPGLRRADAGLLRDRLTAVGEARATGL